MEVTKEQQANIENILKVHTQNKHFFKLNESLKITNTKVKLIADMFELLKNDTIKEKDFIDWLSLHQLDGNNYFFVYEISSKHLTKEFFEDFFDNIDSSIINNIIDCTIESVKNTLLVNTYNDVNFNRAIFTFISPAKVLSKEKLDNGSVQDVLQSQLYYANVIIDYKNNLAIISINPTTKLVQVDGEDKKNGFSTIADLYLKRIKDVIGQFFVRSQYIIPSVLHKLAEEATYHNNPLIEEKLTLAIPKIEKVVSGLLEEFEVEEQAANYYLNGEFQQAFENILIDKYGIECDSQNGYKVFEQKGDKLGSFVYVGCKTDDTNLMSGRLAKVAKATRNNSDITLLGIEYTCENEKFRFYVDCKDDCYLIKSKSIRFTREEVIHDVIEKIEFYKREIQSESSDFVK